MNTAWVQEEAIGKLVAHLRDAGIGGQAPLKSFLPRLDTGSSLVCTVITENEICADLIACGVKIASVSFTKTNNDTYAVVIAQTKAWGGTK